MTKTQAKPKAAAASEEFGPKWDKTVKEPGAEAQVERLWNGGERRRAAEVLVAANLGEAEFDAIVSKHPGLGDLVNRIKGR